MGSVANYGSWLFLVFVTGLAMTCVSGHLLDPIGSVLDPYAPTERHIRMASLISGNFSNEDQSVNATFGYLCMPVRVYALSPDTTYLLEHSFNGIVIRRHFALLRENDKGEIVFRTYNVSAQLPNRPLTRPEISQLQYLPLNAMARNGDECDASFFETDEKQKTFLGAFPDCDFFPPEKKVKVAVLLDCNGISLQSYVGFYAGKIPKVMKPIMRFPLLAHSYNVSHAYYELCPVDNSC